MNIASADPWWTDWPKFLPGWLAFVWTLGVGIRKFVLRRHRLALGAADDELREALTTARGLFEDITAEGRRADWFEAVERRETARKIQDLVDRRRDRTLRDAALKAAQAWNDAFAHAPAASGPMVWISGQYETLQERAEEARVQVQFGKEADVARIGLEDVRAALTRLNELESRSIGRS